METHPGGARALGSQAEHEGRGYLHSNDVVNAGFIQGDTSHVVVQVVYDEHALLDDYEGVEITPITRELKAEGPAGAESDAHHRRRRADRRSRAGARPTSSVAPTWRSSGRTSSSDSTISIGPAAQRDVGRQRSVALLDSAEARRQLAPRAFASRCTPTTRTSSSAPKSGYSSADQSLQGDPLAVLRSRTGWRRAVATRRRDGLPAGARAEVRAPCIR